MFCSLCLSLSLPHTHTHTLSLSVYFLFYASTHTRKCLHGIRAQGLRTSAANIRLEKQTLTGCKTNTEEAMDRGMTSSLPVEKLDRSNYVSWSYKMHQYLLRHGYWSYVEGVNKSSPEMTHKDFPVWEQAASRLMYCSLSSQFTQVVLIMHKLRKMGFVASKSDS